MKNDLTKDQIRQRLQRQAYVETDDGKFRIIDDPMAQLAGCYRFVRDVLNGRYELNQKTADKLEQNQHYAELFSLLPAMRRFSESWVPGVVYHPANAFFFEQYRKHQISHFEIDGPGLVLSDGTSGTQIFLDFIRTLKSEAQSHGLRKKIADHDAKLAKNRKRLRLWERELFRRCSRPVIVRVDLEYLAAVFPAENFASFLAEDAKERFAHSEIYLSDEALEGRELPAMRVSFNEVQKDRVKLFENMKGKPALFKHLIAYVWRIEYAQKTGFHLHLLLAFDGAHVRKHEWLAQGIGQYWANDITKGRGRFHNCNADWDKDAVRYGLGAIKWSDERLRGNLGNFVLPYLAKFDQHILARPYRGCKLMGSGFVHRDKRTARGRPRFSGHQRRQPPVGWVSAPVSELAIS